MAAGCGRVELEREIDYMRESLSSARFVLEVGACSRACVCPNEPVSGFWAGSKLLRSHHSAPSGVGGAG